MLSIACLFDFVPTDLYLAICTSIFVFVHGRVSTYKERFDDIFSYYSRPYEVGDLIEIDPLSVTSSRHQKERFWRNNDEGVEKREDKDHSCCIFVG
jgi:hypothetical protein